LFYQPGFKVRFVFYNTSNLFDIFFFSNNYSKLYAKTPNLGFWLDIGSIHGIS